MSLPGPSQFDVCNYFRFLSRDVWRRIAFARATNLSIRETTITENLLYHFYQYLAAHRAPIRLFESKEEHRNGSDIEVLLNTDSGFLLLACQAKITYKSGNYKKFHHEVGGKRQIDLLMKYAAEHGGIAHYLFYNFIPEYLYSDDVKLISGIDHHGITCIPTDEILAWMSSYEAVGSKPPTPGFNTFHPHQAQPFHKLVCKFLSNGSAHLTRFPQTVNQSIRYYDEDEVEDAETWSRVTSLGQIGYIDEPYVLRNEYEKELDEDFARTQGKPKPPPEFKPKFRLVIGGRDSGGAIYSIS